MTREPVTLVNLKGSARKDKRRPEYDVYIGGAVSNRYYRLKESKFNNVNPTTRKRMNNNEYRLHILKNHNLLSSLKSEIYGKTLACWDVEDSRCHGHTLSALSTAIIPIDESEKGYFTFIRLFSGAPCPLSNYSKTSITHSGTQFLNAQHLITYMKALQLMNRKLVEEIRNATTLTALNRLSNTVYGEAARINHTFDMGETIKIVYYVAKLKFDQVLSFRNECMDTTIHCLPGEVSTSNTWGISPPRNIKDDGGDLSKYEGMNLFGFILALISAEYRGRTRESFFKELRSSLPNGSKLMEGLDLVEKSLTETC